MKSNKKASWFVASIIIASALFIVLYIREAKLIKSPEHILSLPRFKVTDIKGQIIRSSYYAGKIMYVQFVDAYMPHEVELLRKVYDAWGKKDVWFFLIIGNDTPFDLGIEPTPKVTIIDGKQKGKAGDIYSSFGLRRDDGYYFIFNSKGNKISSARSAVGYEKGPKVFLNEIINGTSFSIEELITKDRNLLDYKWLTQVNKMIRANGNRKYFIISLFTKVCDSCAGAAIIHFMKNTHSHLDRSAYIASILSSNFTEADIANMKSQLNIEYPVLLADNELKEKWDELIHKYNEDMLSDIVFIADSTGSIIEIAHRNCNCIGSFIQSAISLLNYKEGGFK